MLHIAVSVISSPGAPKPVKFDFNAASVATDPSIACPKPLRMSPDSPYQQSSDDESREGSPVTMVGARQQSKVSKREVEYETLARVSDDSSSGSETEETGESVTDAAPAPSHGQAPASLPYFAVPSDTSSHRQPTSVLGLQKKEGLPPLPPSPPPRPGKTHMR